MDDTATTAVYRALIIGDLHITPKSTEAIDAIEAALVEILQQPRTPPITRVVFLGDTLHQWNDTKTTLRARAIHLFENIATYAKVVVLIGNHDIIDNEYEGPLHAFYKVSLTNVIFASQPVWFDEHFLAVPYRHKGRWAHVLDTVPGWENAWAIFAHQEFYGGKMDNGEESRDGDEIPPGPLIISGHLHQHHSVQSDCGQVLYVGTPYPTRFGEDDDKALTIATWYENGEVDIERIPVAHAPRKQTLRLTLEEFKNGPPEDARRDTTRAFVAVEPEQYITLRDTAAYRAWVAKGVVPLPQVHTPPVVPMPKTLSLYERVKLSLPDKDHERLNEFWQKAQEEA